MSSGKKEYLKRGVDYTAIDGMRTLPGKYYHSEEIYREEVEKIFYKFWILACRAEEIPEIGDYKLIQVEDESLIIVRDKSNEIKAHFNVCSHRGTQLVTEPTGNFKSKSIQCAYHAWTYALDGKLLGAPQMAEGQGFRKADCTLPQAQVKLWEGFVFISLAENPESFEVQMEALMGKFSAWKMSELRIARHI